MSACTADKPVTNDSNAGIDPKMQACTNFNGTYDPQYKECSGISKDQCEALSGTFNECGSACRHQSNATICTMQCVIYCQM